MSKSPSLIALLFLFAIFSGFAHAKKEAPFPELNDALFNVKFDQSLPITFVGKKSLAVNGGTAGNMMYPGDTAGVFLVSILTHAAISSAAEKARLKKEQEEANKILEPYSRYISAIDTNFLWDEDQLALNGQLEKYSFLFSEQQSDESRWQLDVVPVFAMTQSQQSFLLYNKMTFFDRSFLNPKNKKRPKKLKKGAPNPNEKIVVIVSDPLPEVDAADFWLKEDAAQFNATVKAMYMEAFELGVSRQFGELNAAQSKQITVRYLEDGVKKIERGYVISQTCERTIFESLTGELKSVPNLDYASCASS